MSDWNYLNKCRITHGEFGTTAGHGFCGLFLVRAQHRRLRCIACDEDGWRHVSVSVPQHPAQTPTWEEMARIKALFWEPEDCVVQFHPPESEYVNIHPGCLHLWQPTAGEVIRMPEGVMV